MRHFAAIAVAICIGALPAISCSARAEPQDKCAELLKKLLGNSSAPSTAPSVKALSQDEVKALTKTRACMLSFPWPKGFDAHTDLDSVTVARMKSIRDNVYSLESTFQSKYSTYTKQQINRLLEDESVDFQLRKYTYWRHGGWEPEQVKLYADFFYVQTLLRDGKYQEAHTLISQLSADGRLSLATHSLDEAEQSSYFHAQTLRNLLGAVDLIARQQLSSGEAERLAILVDYLDNRDAFSAIGDMTGKLEERLFDAFSVDSMKTAVQRPDARYSKVAGIVDDAGTPVAVFRGKKLHVVRFDETNGVQILEPANAAAWIRSFSAKEVSTRSSPHMKLFGYFAHADGAELDVGKARINLSEADIKKIRAGTALEKEHALTKWLEGDAESAKVLYSNCLMQQTGPERLVANEFTFALQKAYPDIRIYRDPLSDDTSTRVKNLNSFSLRSSEDLVFVTADSSFKIEDWNIINNALSDPAIKESGIEVVHFTATETPKWERGEGKAVIAITGHSETELAVFVHSLGKAGYFKGNAVMFQSCGTPLTDTLVYEIINKYGAAAVYSYEGTIRPSAVEDVIHNLAISLKQIFSGDAKQKFVDIVRKAVAKTPLRGIWTICNLMPLISGDRRDA